jgi:E3 ubiquitin-protein ligase UHRF1
MQTVRIRRVTVAGVQNDLVLTVPLTSRIEGLQKLIYDELEVYPSEQKLYYGGKEVNFIDPHFDRNLWKQLYLQLIPDHLVTDYKIKNGDVIQLLVRHFTCNVEESESDDSTECANLTSTASNYYRTGDTIDVVYSELGAWFEAKVVKIFVDQSLERVREEDLIFQVVMDRNERTAPINVKFNEIRPRARYIYETAELRAGMMVLVNYNIQKPRERGYW